MKKLSQKLLANTVRKIRKQKNMTQMDLASLTGINRSMIGRIENEEYLPLIPQLEALAAALDFDITDMFVEDRKATGKNRQALNIAVAGTGYVGLSLAVLLAQHNHVTAVDILPKKVDKINNRISPIQNEYIEKYIKEKKLDLTATLDGPRAYSTADFVIIAAPTNYDSKKNYFDTSAVESVIESVIESVLDVNPDAVMVIKSTIPVGYTESVKRKYRTKNIIFSPEFLRESKALYDNLYPSRIIVSCDTDMEKKAHIFAELL